MVCKSQIDVLASLVHPRSGKWNNRFVMMEAYLDESGIHAGAKVCVVAGYYGSHKNWRTFEAQWNKVLSAYPEVASKGFHAKHFFGRGKDGNRVKEYKGWSEDKAYKFMERLTQAIMRNRIFPVGYAVVVDDFAALTLNMGRWLTGAEFSKNGEYIKGGSPSRSYYLPFEFCVLKSCQKSNANPVDKIHFFAGLDRTFYEYANVLFKLALVDERLPMETRNQLGTIAYPLAKDTPGIQAADLLCNRLYRRALYALANPRTNPTPLLSNLLKNWQGGAPKLVLLNEAAFEQMEKKAEVMAAKRQARKI